MSLHSLTLLKPLASSSTAHCLWRTSSAKQLNPATTSSVELVLSGSIFPPRLQWNCMSPHSFCHASTTAFFSFLVSLLPAENAPPQMCCGDVSSFSVCPFFSDVILTSVVDKSEWRHVFMMQQNILGKNRLCTCFPAVSVNNIMLYQIVCVDLQHFRQRKQEWTFHRKLAPLQLIKSTQGFSFYFFFVVVVIIIW